MGKYMANKFEYNDERHEYKINGIIVPGPSIIFKELGLVNFDNVNTYILERSKSFGKAVHKVTQLYDNDDLDESILDESLKPSLLAWKKFKELYKIEKIIANEMSVFSLKYMFAGTLDKVFVSKGKLILPDIKTSTKINTIIVGIQTAFYQIAYEEMTGEKINKRLCIQLGINDIPNIIPLDNKNDKENALHCLAVYNLKKLNKVI